MDPPAALAPGPTLPAGGPRLNQRQHVVIAPALDRALTVRVTEAFASLSPAEPVDIATLSQAELDACPATTLLARSPQAGFSRLAIPRFAAILDDIRDTGLTVEQGGRTLRVLTTWAIACRNQTARVLLLSPSNGDTLRTYEDDVTELCLRLRDGRQGRWFCTSGTLGAGVPAFGAPWGKAAVPRDRVTLLRSVKIGPNTWTLHFARVPGLGPISGRSAHPDGFAWPLAWNLNPNDRWPDGSSKATDYLAAIAVKTTTATNGAPISVYNHNGALDPAWLNDCESDGDKTYLAHPELGSLGTFAGVFLDVVASEEVFARCRRWMEPLGFRVVRAAERVTAGDRRCRYLRVGSELRVGLNTSDAFPDRQQCGAR